MVGVGAGRSSAASATTQQSWLAVLTVVLIVALAYLMNYSGLAYTLGLGASSVGHSFVLVSPFLGWLAVFLSGSDTSGNALFGNLQVVAARPARSRSGAVRRDQFLGRRDGQDDLAAEYRDRGLGHRPAGQEGVVFARTFWHSIVLTLMLGVLVAIQQFVVPGIIPHLMAKADRRSCGIL